MFAGFFVSGFPLDHESLSHMREIQIVVEFGCYPYFANFYPSVIRGITLNEIRVLGVFKIKCDIFKKCGLVVFDGEVVIRMALANQVVSKVTLGQECICGNDLAFNIDGIKQWNGSLYFVGPLEFF